MSEVENWEDLEEGTTPLEIANPEDFGEVSDEEDGVEDHLGREKMKISIVGDNALSRAMAAIWDVKITDVSTTENGDDIDRIIAGKPSLIIVCCDVPYHKNGNPDDAEIISIITKVAKDDGEAGIMLKSTINMETVERIYGAVGADWFVNKFLYAPVIGDDPMDVIHGDVAFFGGHPRAIEQAEKVLETHTHFSAKQVIKGSVFEVLFAKLGLVGFTAIREAYWNQYHQTILDVGGANPQVVRKMMESHPIVSDTRTMVPSYVKAMAEEGMTLKKARSYSGEYQNKDVQALVSMTDRLTLLDEAYNKKNLETQ
jgi:hypothetical protein